MPDNTGTRIGAIDGLRAVAMTMVVLQHCDLLPFGWMGVWLFYVISGFVVCGTFHREAERPRQEAGPLVVNFFRRRAVRIWPLYFLYIILTLVFLVAIHHKFNPGDIAALFSFTFNWQMILQFAGPLTDWPGIGHLWTISVEQQFYLVFPLLYFIALAARPRPAVIWTIVLLSPVIRYLIGLASVLNHQSPEFAAFAVYASSIGHFDAFLIGALLARYSKEIVASPTIEKTTWTAVMGLIAVYVALQIGAHVVVDNRHGVTILKNIISGTLYGHFCEVFAYYVPVLGGAALIISVLKANRLLTPLTAPVLRGIGEISYGCYILHLSAIMLWVHILGNSEQWSLGHSLRLFACVYASTLAVAWLSYRYFETPFRRLRPSTSAAGRPAQETT